MNLFVFTQQIVKVSQRLNVWHTCPVNHINTSEVDSFYHHLISLISSLSLSPLSFGLHKEQFTHGKKEDATAQGGRKKEDTVVAEGLFD